MTPCRAVVASLAVVTLAACADTSLPPTAPSASIPSLDVSSENPAASRHIFVFAEKRIPVDFAGRVAAAGGTIERAFGGMGIAAVQGLSAEAAAQLGASADIKSWNHDVELTLDQPASAPEVEMAGMENVVASPTDPALATFYPRQWHLRQIGADVAWNAGKRGSRTVKVGILDTGIDYEHPDLVGLVDLQLSKSFVPADNAVIQANFPGAHEIADLHYHGTHVAATVSSNALAAAGVTSNLTLVGIKVLNRNGSGNSLITLDAIAYAADIGLDVINMSLGVALPLSLAEYGWFNDMINRDMEYAFSKGVVVVVSAGN